MNSYRSYRFLASLCSLEMTCKEDSLKRQEETLKRQEETLKRQEETLK